ncbi:unnamed protein product [Penicillium salamii]|nr:unnamed protein product [Penicillium salamii]CAG8290584.1 unnamed protein product [Penicillium salamii]CAG8399794.1 unnamed protein product [Penicillium salamii]
MTDQRPICRDFLRGNCSKDVCNLAHVNLDQSHAPISTHRTQRAAPNSQFTENDTAFSQSKVTFDKEAMEICVQGCKDNIPLHPTSVPKRAPETQPGIIDTPGGRHNNDFADICRVKIMPSYDEIRCSRSDYLPTVDPSQWHIQGIDGLLDRNFRLLREDTVGQIRDTVRHHIIPSAKHEQPPLRSFVHQNARILNLGFNWSAGLYVEIDFPQPAAMGPNPPLVRRQGWWEASKRFSPGDLVCLVIQNDLVLFCTVANQIMLPRRKHSRDPPERAEPTSLWNDLKRASVKLTLFDSRFTNIQLILDLYGTKEPPVSVIGFPDVLLASFEPSLRALQCMKSRGNLPFSDIFVPWISKSSRSPQIPATLHTSQPSYAYNLRCLLDTDVDFFIQPGEFHEVQVDYLREHSTLDQGQARALINCLSRRLGLVQGPPGTGKSYIGQALIKVLLGNRDEGSLGPILCVTYTNHALDQLLEALLDNKVTSQIVRVGSQSQSEKLEQFSLHAISRLDLKTKGEKGEIRSISEKLSSYEHEFHSIDLQRHVSIDQIRRHVQQHHIHHYKELFQATNPSTIESWVDSGVQNNAQPRSTTELENVHVSDMSGQERLKIYNRWYRECRGNMDRRVTKLVESHGTAKSRYEIIHDNMNLRRLIQADVIGVTTSGLARRLDMFRQLPCKFMICEEAGEVLEPHLLTAFLPSVEHAVLIGDQQQLRPRVQSYDLSRENPQGGSRYSLDVSLFERLVNSDKTPIDCGHSYSTLDTQRRMHPEISRLVRDTLYPRLINSFSVFSYPEIRGMRKRLFWLDHRSKEDSRGEDGGTATSHWNSFEADMSVALVAHLVRQDYRFRDIAVLTPYLGQLNKLKDRLAKAFPIALGDRDKTDLAQAGHEGKIAQNIQVDKESPHGTLRVATVDNFQGEEAKIVVISLVRSNSQNNCGFLRTSNRINVLLSRAQHGMYIIGNSETSRYVPMWAKVIHLLEQGRNIGPALELKCPRHPGTVMNVSSPGSLIDLSPEGGCKQRCVYRLKCGHACTHSCHSAILHSTVVCSEPCLRSLRGCAHPCPNQCGMACPDKCMVKIPQKQRLSTCSHFAKDFTCWQNQNISTFQCKVQVLKKIPGCNHAFLTSCCVDVETTDFRCGTKCSSILSCGHTCKGVCHQCVTKGSEGIKIDHVTCKERCNRKRPACSHTCSRPCHGKAPCPPCREPCKSHCGHSRCLRECTHPCPPCTEEKCLPVCPHRNCSLPCAAPCDHRPCSKRCNKRLRCGHQCPSVCGEVCPQFFCCQLCGNKDVKDREVDPVLKSKYSDINLNNTPCLFPECGHFVTIQTMDTHMEMASHYGMDNQGRPSSPRNPPTPFCFQSFKRCPTCLSLLKSFVRYSRLTHRAAFDESVKKLNVLINEEFVPLALGLGRIVRALGALNLQKGLAWSAPIEISGTRWDQVTAMREVVSATNPGQWDDILDLRERIERHRRRIQPEEQAFQNFHQLLSRYPAYSNTTSSLKPVNTGPRTKGLLQVNALLMCLDLALLASFSALLIKARESKIRVKMQFDLQTTKEDCQWIIDEAKSSRRIFHQTEGYIYLAMVHAFEHVHSSTLKQRIVLAGLGQDALVHAKALCTAHPDQTEGLPYQVDCVEEMLDDNKFYAVVAGSKRLADISAMQQTYTMGTEWYYCIYGHSFTCQESESALKNGVCPECDVRLVI